MFCFIQCQCVLGSTVLHVSSSLTVLKSSWIDQLTFLPVLKHTQLLSIIILIGITPQGTVSFISKGWGGRVSDKHLTQNSNLLTHLIPGDTIIADRGFDIKESTAMYCAHVTVPTFTKGKKQLTGIEVEQTRRLANVRIHVERVIGLIRQKFSLLNHTQPIDYVISRNDSIPLLDKIVTVCCALINLCDSVIPPD